MASRYVFRKTEYCKYLKSKQPIKMKHVLVYELNPRQCKSKNRGKTYRQIDKNSINYMSGFYQLYKDPSYQLHFDCIQRCDGVVNNLFINAVHLGFGKGRVVSTLSQHLGLLYILPKDRRFYSCHQVYHIEVGDDVPQEMFPDVD